MRTFISIEFPKEIKEEILKIQKQLPSFNGKKIEFENLHLTLKFLGEIDEKTLSLIKERLRKVKTKQFFVEINSMGMFSDKIIWIGIMNCEELQKEIDKTLNGVFEPESRFMGHLTIARIKQLKNRREFLEKIKRIKIIHLKFRAEKFNLKKSTLTEKGPVYEDIEVYNLKI
jgi:RNA 2',3'-cyclic 3'-phosphodiesterase